MAASPLYTDALLDLALALPDDPPLAAADATAELRSRSCGSRIAIALQLDANGTIAAMSADLQACVLGQASSAILLLAAPGRDRPAICAAADWLEAMMAGERLPPPDWPRLDELSAAAAYPGRREALLLPWRAAIAALDNGMRP